MKQLNKLLLLFAAAFLFLTPWQTFAQAPNLGSTANFVLFTGVGAITNGATPIYLTHLTGNVGSNSGAPTGFGNIDGTFYSGGAVTTAATADLAILSVQLDTITATSHPSSAAIGGGDTLLAGVYAYAGAATLNGNLYLDARGNANAVFIFQIPGVNTFDPTPNSKIILINGAKACNVFWKVGGAIGSIATGTNSTLRGTFVSNGAINLYSGDTLEGRALSTIGAISLNGTGGIIGYTPIGCGSPHLTGPVAPSLGPDKYFAILTGNGAVNDNGTSRVNGDVGALIGSIAGFTASFVNGTIHPVGDAPTATAVGHLDTVYNYLDGLAYDIELTSPSLFGHNLVLTPHTYLLGAATTLTDTVILDAQGDVNAVFVFQISGAIGTTASSLVKLINGTQAKNIYWKVTGATTPATNSIFNGNIIGGGGAAAIDASAPGSRINGRLLTTSGAITTNATTINPDVIDEAGPITGSDSTVCVGATLALAGADTGGVWSASNGRATVSTTGIVTGVSQGLDTIRYIATNRFGSDTATYKITVKPLPIAGPITGPSSVCIDSSIVIAGADTGGTFSRSNSNATISTAGVITGITAGIDTITYIATNSCGSDTATKIITVNPNPNAGTITGPSVVCVGASITLGNTSGGGTWSATNSRATINSSGVVTGVTTGVDTIRYIVNGACGRDTTTRTITISPTPNAGTITGPSVVCVGASITLGNTAGGGSWSATNGRATITSGGVVTGISAGLDTVVYTVTNSCGTDTTTRTITISPTPNAGTITGASVVCVGASITLGNTAGGGSWSATNGRATITSGGVVTGVSAGLDTVVYTVTNSCGTDTTTRTITISPTPNAGTITGASVVCVGASITLGNTAGGGSWSATNGRATITGGGVVTGASAGLDTVVYTVSNSCGTDTTTRTITINALPNAGTITGTSVVCVGASITLGNTAGGGSWSATNGRATITSGGVVTGVSAGLDTVVYTVTNTCGTDTTTRTITINALPNAGTITGTSVVCVGASITLGNTAGGGAWSATNGNATVSGAGVVTGIITGTDTIIYTVTTACGTDTAAKIITINPLPNAGTITGGSTVCELSLIVLSNAVTGGTWTASNTNASVTSTGVVSGNTAGIDTIRYTVTNSCGTAFTTAIITVNPLPNAGVITGASSVCLGSSITLTDTTGTGTWSATNGNATITSGGVVNSVTTGVDTIRYTVTNSCGTATATKVITINALPTLSSTKTPAAICDRTIFSYTPTSDTVSATYAWTRPVVLGISNNVASSSGGISETLINISANSILVTYIYTVTAHGCSATQNVTVLVHPTPKLSSVDSTSTCSGSSFDYIATGYTVGTTFTWNRPTVTGVLPTGNSGTGDIHETLINSTVTPVNVVYNYTLTANGCSASQNVKVTVNPVPGSPVITTSSPATLCSGTMYQNFGTNSPVAGVQYHWSAINATVWATAANGQNALINFPNTGTALVRLTTNLFSFPCSSSAVYTVNVSSSVADIPVVQYFQNHFVCTPNTENAYQWGYDDVTTLDSTILTGEINQDYVNTNPDIAHKYYWVMTGGASGCHQKTYYRIPNAIVEVNTTAATLDIYPNPASDLINVAIHTTTTNDIEVEVMNMAGQKLTTIQAADNKASINVANYPGGIYMISCYSNGVKIATSKFIKN